MAKRKMKKQTVVAKRQYRVEEIPTRVHCLQLAIDATGKQRNSIYGEPHNNLSCLVELKAVYKKYAGDKYSAVHDEAIGHVFGKLARIAAGNGQLHEDNYIDGAAYLAIAAECQNIEDERAIIAQTEGKK